MTNFLRQPPTEAPFRTARYEIKTDKVTMDPSASNDSEDESSDLEVVCLMGVGKNSDWLRLVENIQVSIGRGFGVTYQLVSPCCPLMISRLHCTFCQREDGHWTVTDKQSLNGVWVNGIRIPTEKAHLLQLGDSVRLGVPIVGSKAEFDYKLVKRPLREIQHKLLKGQKTSTKVANVPMKRKLIEEEGEPSTSKTKLYRCSDLDKSVAQPCPLSPAEHQECHSCAQLKEAPPKPDVEDSERACGVLDVPCDLDNLQMHIYSQNISMLREQVDSTQTQVTSLEVEPQSADPFREEQINQLQQQLKTLQAKLLKMEMFERSVRETKKQQEPQKTQQQKELMEKQLENTLQEVNIIHKTPSPTTESRAGRRRHRRQNVLTKCNWILLDKNKELEVTKAEKEKARAQKEEVVTQVTTTLENELQCIICSELLIEAVTLNCAHSFCCYCIKQWRKKKEECPICRQAIKSQTQCLALNNFIDSMVENLSLDIKIRRQTLVSERKGELCIKSSHVGAGAETST
ncbi:E3 ubiquitin-protein ligase rnf8 isoform X2 [Syngnathus typhle]|uniref:E3 ubiquitin-protein ligase rnf8 isoform X2 n=1 Tax=Syngnathus typhle TaxID=161592 RepID=UPI002A6B88D1|nr:E3 ubiquitin-protein ligase rnf8 isoform X2 [Syngnathus typhle]